MKDRLVGSYIMLRWALWMLTKIPTLIRVQRLEEAGRIDESTALMDKMIDEMNGKTWWDTDNGPGGDDQSGQPRRDPSRSV